jgi:bifunctional DNase/RNase
MVSVTVPEGWVELRLRGLILDPTSEAPVLILREVDGTLYLPIWIGAFEANAIALALERVRTPRPLTHDLMRATLETLGVRLERVEIHTLTEGVFYARLRLRGRDGPIEVDSRPSDAIALALRAEAPIWAARSVLDAALGAARAVHEPDEEKILEWLERASAEDLGKYSM